MQRPLVSKFLWGRHWCNNGHFGQRPVPLLAHPRECLPCRFGISRTSNGSTSCVAGIPSLLKWQCWKPCLVVGIRISPNGPPISWLVEAHPQRTCTTQRPLSCFRGRCAHRCVDSRIAWSFFVVVWNNPNATTPMGFLLTGVKIVQISGMDRIDGRHHQEDRATYCQVAFCIWWEGSGDKEGEGKEFEIDGVSTDEWSPLLMAASLPLPSLPRSIHVT